MSNWAFETKQIVARKSKNFGDAYTGVLTITITDGVPHIEGLLCTDFTKEDFEEIKAFISGLGFKEAVTSSFVDGKRVTKIIVA